MRTSQFRGSAQKCLPSAAAGCRGGSDPTRSPREGCGCPAAAHPGRAQSPERCNEFGDPTADPVRAGVESEPSRAPAPSSLSPRLQPPAVGGQGGATTEGLSPLRRHQKGQTEPGLARIAELCSQPFPPRPACSTAAPGSLPRLKPARAPPRSRGRCCRTGSGARLAGRAPGELRRRRGASSRTPSPKGGTEHSGPEL